MAVRLAARPRRLVLARCLMRRRRVAGGLRDLIAKLGISRSSRSVTGSAGESGT